MPQNWIDPRNPRQWQVEALAGWKDRGRRGIAHVVTGAGKTRFAEMCIFDFASAHQDGRILVVVPTLALLDQWYVDLQDELGVQSEEIAVYSGEGRSSQPKRLNLAVLNTARAVAPDLSKPVPTFLIVDECHRAATPINSKALAGVHAATLGLSATPMREYDTGFEDILEPSLGGIFYSYDYDDARRDGVITQFSLMNVSVPLTQEEQEGYDALSRRVGRAARAVDSGTGDVERLKRLLQMRASLSGGAKLRVPVSVSLAEEYRGSRMVIFHERISAAEDIVALLKERGHNATIYHSRISDAVRRDNLRLFRRGAFQVLVSCRALDEGMNVPEAEVGIIASSTASSRQRIQRLGRVLRPARGKSSAMVITLFATEIEEKRLRTEAENMDSASEVIWKKAGLPGA